MFSARRLFASAFVAAVTLPSVMASAAVSLSFTDNVAPNTSGPVTRGSAFDILLNLTSTAEQPTGVNYFLRSPGTTANYFKIVARNVLVGPFTDTYKTETEVKAEPGSIIDDNGNALDLGATIANPTAPLPASTYAVATYSILVDPATPVGTYTIQTFSLPGTGVTINTSPFDVPFSAHATYSVTVQVPEPTHLALLPLLGLTLLRRRRDRVV